MPRYIAYERGNYRIVVTVTQDTPEIFLETKSYDAMEGEHWADHTNGSAWVRDPDALGEGFNIPLNGCILWDILQGIGIRKMPKGFPYKGGSYDKVLDKLEGKE